MFSSLSDIPDENQAILLIENWPTTGSKSDIAILRQLSWGRNTIQAGGTPRSEHLRPDYSWNPGRNRLFSDASRIDLGLDQLGTPTKTTNCPSDSVADRICFCNRFGRPSRFVGRVCSGSPLSVLRPLASEDISMGRFAFPRGNPVWNLWCVTSGSIAVAGTRLRAGNVGVLVACGGR